MIFFFIYLYRYHRDLHVLTHSFPTRRSSDLSAVKSQARASASPSPASRARATCTSSYQLPADAVFLVCQRSEEHTSELQSLMRISYAVFCLKKKINI